MKKIFLVLLLISATLQSQINAPTTRNVYKTQNGITQVQTITGDQNIIPGNVALNPKGVLYQSSSVNASILRWPVFDTYSIADFCQTSANGLYQVIGWNLNSPERVSLFGNTNNIPFWEFNTFVSPNYYNHVAISDTGDVIASGSYNNIYMFHRANNTPFFNYSLGTDTAGPVALTSNGKFMIACSSRQTDTSAIYAFSSDSAHPVWKYKIGQIVNGGSLINGIKISRNDSLVIVNNYGGFFVFKTYTGQLVFSGTTGSTQSQQGISGNGNIIAIINYSGYLKVYQWNGTTYNLLWQFQEPPGTYYNWMYSVDVSNDGSMIAAGTLDFVTGSSFDGRVRFFRTANGSTPVWTYSGVGDAVVSVSFSKNGNVLGAVTYGDNNNTVPDLLVFKISAGNAPIYTLNTPGSLFWVSVSDDGSTVMASGKKVPARAGFGYGGEAYNIFIDTTDSPLGIHQNNSTPTSFSLKQNYPNPFNPTTQIDYSVGKEGMVNITIFDVLGREVATLVNKFERAGNYSISFDASNLNSGVYLYRIRTENYTDTKKMVLIK